MDAADAKGQQMPEDEPTTESGRPSSPDMAEGPWWAPVNPDHRQDDGISNDEDDDDGTCDDFITSYALRPQTRAAGRDFGSTWYDADETGNYDPNEEARKRKALHDRARARRRARTAPRDEVDKPAPTEPEEPLQLIVQLVFHTVASRQRLARCVEDAATKIAIAFDDGPGAYRLRKRGVDPSTNQQARPYDTNSDIPEDVTGHPRARGCYECWSLGQDCSLLDDERSWPCASCTAEGTDCDLVIPPIVKRTCESCKRRKAPCSFTTSTDHDGPCDACDAEDFHCIAGPVKNGIRPRIRYDRDWANDPLVLPKIPNKVKTVWTCQQCQAAGVECSFTAGGSGNDCERCRSTNTLCFPEQVVMRTSRPSPAKKRASDHDALSPDKRAKPTPTTTAKPAHPPPPTKLTQPILFNHKPTPTHPHPCSFCDNSSVSILGSRHTTVPGAATTMCIPCTTRRAAISMCPHTTLEPLKDGKQASAAAVLSPAQNYQEAMTALFTTGKVRKEDTWCSLCPTLARFGCCTHGESHGGGGGGIGCGLKLCGLCEGQLSGKYGGDLQAMLKDTKEEDSEARPLGLRADVGLLRREGVLMRFIVEGA